MFQLNTQIKISCLFSLFLACFSGLIGINLCYADNTGVTNQQVVIGQSCGLTGPAKEMGVKLSAGMDAYFAKVNAAGGINGRQIKLITKDDGYEPNRAYSNTLALIDQDKVFLLIGETGTPTSKAVLPLVEKYKIPFLTPYSGARLLRQLDSNLVINLRGSYHREIEKIAVYLTGKEHLNLKRVACFYQNDSYGLDGLNGVKAVLKERGMKMVAAGSYERNTMDVDNALAAIYKAKPEAVIMIGTAKPSAKFIKLSKEKGLKNVVFANVSFVGEGALRNELGSEGDGVIVSEIVPYPWDNSMPVVKEYADAMKKYAPQENLGFTSLEGFLDAKLFCQILSSLKEVTRENFMAAVKKQKHFDLGGVEYEYGKGDNEGINYVLLTVLKNGKSEPLLP